MTRIEWNDFLSVGHAKIDEDHKHLLEILNRLADSEERRKRDVVAKAVNDMAAYASEHFAREEELMKAINYPLLAEHTERHKELTAKVAAWQRKLTGRWHPWHGGTFFAVLAHWLVSHILDDDRLVADFRRTGRVGHRFRKQAAGKEPFPALRPAPGKGLDPTRGPRPRRVAA